MSARFTLDQISKMSPKIQAQVSSQFHPVSSSTPTDKTPPRPSKPAKNRSANAGDSRKGAFVACGLPEPITEHQFHHSRKWRFDYAWPAYMIALEVEGGIWTNGRHTRGSGFLADIEKYNEAAIAGWRVLRCTPDELLSFPVMDMLKKVLP